MPVSSALFVAVVALSFNQFSVGAASFYHWLSIFLLLSVSFSSTYIICTVDF